MSRFDPEPDPRSMDVIPASIAAFFICCATLLVVRPLAQGLGLIDKPGGRKAHHGEVPVVGGIAMFSGLLVSTGGAPGLDGSGMALLVVSAFMVVVGALDDRFDLSPRIRLFAHLSASVALVYATGYSVSSLGDLFGWRPLDLGLLAIPFTVVAVVALINAFNMLDGLDGLAGTVGAIALGGIMIMAGTREAEGVVLVAGSMLGAVVAFLVFNLPAQWNRSIRTFMGDAGSTLLGFLLSALALMLIQPDVAGVTPVTILWLMPIPIFELFTSTARRVIRGISPAQADTGHFHHVLIRAGLSVRAVCSLYVVFSLACSCVGIWMSQSGAPEPVVFAGFVLAIGVWLLLVRLMSRVAGVLPAWFRRTDVNLGN